MKTPPLGIRLLLFICFILIPVSVTGCNKLSNSGNTSTDTIMLSADENEFRIYIYEGKEKYLLSAIIYAGFLQGSNIDREIKERMPIIREEILIALGTKIIQELEVRHIPRLKAELRSIVNSQIARGSIQEIYFSSYSLKKITP